MPSKRYVPVVDEWDRTAEVREAMELGPTSATLSTEAERRIRNLREVLSVFAAMELRRSRRRRIVRS